MGIFGANLAGKQLVQKWQILWLFSGKISLEIDRLIALIRPAFLMFFYQRSSFALSTTIRSRNEPMAKPLTSWLVPSFSQHNLHLVVLECCLHVSVTKFWDKFVSLRQVNTPSNWDKFQNCCTDMYLIRFLPVQILQYFGCFCEFRRFAWISQLCDHAKYQKPCP